MKELFDKTLEEVELLHQGNHAIQDFVSFPNDFAWRELTHHNVPAARLMTEDQSLVSDDYYSLRNAFIAPWQFADWRETYKDTNIGNDFLSRFACYELYGHDGHFKTEKARGFLVYSDANLYYPWHHHPAEELYLGLSQITTINIV